MDDNLLLYASNHTSIQMTLEDFNNLHPKLQFTAEEERDHTLNFLDFSIHRNHTNIKTDTYRKSTLTHIIIPYTSSHPTHHKYAAVGSLQWNKTPKTYKKKNTDIS